MDLESNVPHALELWGGVGELDYTTFKLDIIELGSLIIRQKNPKLIL